MSITDFKRKSKKAYFFTGAVCILIPALIAVGVLVVMFYNCNARNRQLENELSKQKKNKGYVLTEDVSAGTKITGDMLKEVHLTGGKEALIQSVDKEELVGHYVKSAFSKGTCMNSQCVYEDEEYSPDMRIHEFEFIEVSETLQTGEFVDIRILYPNGEDYIIVNHKQIMDIRVINPEQTESGSRIYLKVTEEENLRLASAWVDREFYPGSRIYAVSYLDQFQQSGIVNYPVNSQVFQLLGWNPNLIDYAPSEEETQHRSVLENNLSQYAKSDTTIISRDNGQKTTADTDAFFE